MILLHSQSKPIINPTGFRGHTHSVRTLFFIIKICARIQKKHANCLTAAIHFTLEKTYHPYRAPAHSVLMLYSPCLRRNHRLFEVPPPTLHENKEHMFKANRAPT